jgi:signal peptidase
MSDKKVLHIISASLFAVLLVVFLIPFETAGRIIAAAVFVVAAILTYFMVKKRSILSMNKQQVLLIMAVIAVVYLMLYYLTGIDLGFYKNIFGWNAISFFSRLVPAALIIAASEVYRWIIRAQDDRPADILCYLSCVLAEMIVCSTANVAVSSFSSFMSLVAETMFPAVVANLLYSYLSKRYGFYPNIVYRAITTLYIYLIPILPALSMAITSFINLFLPIGIYLFIDAMYERKRRYALAKKSKLEVPITILAVAAMLITVMVVSNHFYVGSYVIATESMTGELNKGDVAIYERYEDQTVIEGQVIAFEKDDIVVIHRVVEIQIINGQNRYFTKGDANENRDSDFIYDSDIIGLVTFKIPYLGYPTLWLRSLFAR